MGRWVDDEIWGFNRLTMKNEDLTDLTIKKVEFKHEQKLGKHGFNHE